MSTKSNNNAVAARHARPWLGADVGFGFRDFTARPDGARLFQRLRAIEAAADRWRRRHSAVRARAPAAVPAVSAASGRRNHAAISRPDDPGAEPLEIRSGWYRRGVPAGGHAAEATTVCLPDVRRRLQGCHYRGLYGA